MDRSPTFAVLAVLAVLALAACSEPAGSAGEGAPPATAVEARGPLIATLVTNGARVAIVGGGPELRYDVRGGDGAVVADGVTADELRAADPLLFELVRGATASRGTWLDASR